MKEFFPDQKPNKENHEAV